MYASNPKPDIPLFILRSFDWGDDGLIHSPSRKLFVWGKNGIATAVCDTCPPEEIATNNNHTCGIYGGYTFHKTDDYCSNYNNITTVCMVHGHCAFGDMALRCKQVSVQYIVWRQAFAHGLKNLPFDGSDWQLAAMAASSYFNRKIISPVLALEAVMTSFKTWEKWAQEENRLDAFYNAFTVGGEA